jgi:hypothetical protein
MKLEKPVKITKEARVTVINKTQDLSNAGCNDGQQYEQQVSEPEPQWFFKGQDL